MKNEKIVEEPGNGIHPDDFRIGIHNGNGEILPALRDELPKSTAKSNTNVESNAKPKVEIQSSDLRFGHIDDDGQPMSEIIAMHSGGEKDAIPVPKGEQFIKPTIVDDDLRDIFVSLMAKKSGKIIPFTMPVYLCNKLVDTTVHSNDYIKLEGNDFEFTHIITTCQGVYSVASLFGAEKLTSDIIENVDEEFKEEHFDSTTAEDDEPSIPKSFFDGINTEYIDDLDEEYRIPLIKIKDLFAVFQQNCCEHRKSAICKRRHFLVGEGAVRIEDEPYEGIFIYLYPDVHYEQADNPDKEIADKHYQHFNENAVYPQNRIDYVVAYKEEFRKLLKAISK